MTNKVETVVQSYRSRHSTSGNGAVAGSGVAKWKLEIKEQWITGSVAQNEEQWNNVSLDILPTRKKDFTHGESVFFV